MSEQQTTQDISASEPNEVTMSSSDPQQETNQAEQIIQPKKCGDNGSSAESGIQSNSSEHSNSLNASGDDTDDENDSTVKEQDEHSEENQMAAQWSPLEEDQSPCHSAEGMGAESGKKGIVKNQALKKNRHIRFACVREYLFNRQQSFCTLPSTGGCALGMESNHHDTATIPLPVHRERLHSKRRKKLRHWRRKQRRLSVNGGLTAEHVAQEVSDDITTSSDSDSDAPEEDLSGVDDWWFLQPIAPKKRRKILKRHSGEIDSQDRGNNRLLRSSREVCGCSCIGVCHPDTCECSSAGIPCQVDRDGFPCGCQVGRCGNSSGRRSFNSARVRHHFFKTMYRLRCQEQGQDPVTPPTQPEVPIDEPQQPFSFGDFTRPSDFQGTIYWPQQWDHQSPATQWSGMQQSVTEESTSSRLCESVPQIDEQAILQSACSLSSESSAEDTSSMDGNPSGNGKSDSNVGEVAAMPEEHEANITVVNDDSHDSQESHDSLSVE